MESGSGGEGYGDRVVAELARLREALDDLRRRPVPPDADTLRHVVTASLTEAAAPPPNLLVTAIRRLDRLDARLESIEGALGAPAALPRGQAATARSRAPASPAPIPPQPLAADPEAIADALARRLAGMISPRAAAAPAQAPAARVEDLVSALRPLVPEAARSVLRRAGREPSPQAVEVLQQTALSAIEEAIRSLHAGGLTDDPWAPDPRALSAPPQALAPAPPASAPPASAPSPPPPAPPPIDVDELAATIAAQVAAALTAQLRPPAPVEEPPARPPEPPPPPPAPPIDPKVVADAVISRLAEQPPPQAIVSPMAMAPLLSAVGNVEAAVARIVEPEAQVVSAVDRLEAGVGALARALEDDRSLQADEVRRGFAQLQDLLGGVAPAAIGAAPGWTADLDDGTDALGAGEEDAGSGAGGGAEPDASGTAAGPGTERIAGAVAGLQRRLDRLSRQLEPLAEADLAVAVPEITTQGQRLERSLNHILTALAALAEHLHEQSATWRGRFDDLDALVAAGSRAAAAGPEPSDAQSGDLGDVATRVDELVSGLAADRQRFQRLGGTIDGLAELLGLVSSRLDRLPRSLGAADDLVDDQVEGQAGQVPAPPLDPPEAARFAVAEPPPPVEDDLPPHGDRPVAPAAPPGSSPWDDADDEPWMRDDPWAARARGGDRSPAPPVADGEGGDQAAIASDEPESTDTATADREPFDGMADDPPIVEASNGSASHVEPPTDRGLPDAGPLDDGHEQEQEQRGRRRRNRRGNRRG